MKRLNLTLLAGLLVIVPIAAYSQNEWEGMSKVKSTRMDLVYLLPGADIRAYTKIKLDPTEVAFRPNFVRDYNRTAQLGARISDREATEMMELARTTFEEIFSRAHREAGWQIVEEAGPDVLRLRTGVVNLVVNAPDQMTAGRTRSYSVEAGEATLVIEARDSLTGALLGRAIDQRLVGDYPGVRTQISNRADFEELFRTWARTSVRGLEELKANSPFDPNARRSRR